MCRYRIIDHVRYAVISQELVQSIAVNPIQCQSVLMKYVFIIAISKRNTYEFIFCKSLIGSAASLK